VRCASVSLSAAAGARGAVLAVAATAAPVSGEEHRGGRACGLVVGPSCCLDKHDTALLRLKFDRTGVAKEARGQGMGQERPGNRAIPTPVGKKPDPAFACQDQAGFGLVALKARGLRGEGDRYRLLYVSVKHVGGASRDERNNQARKQEPPHEILSAHTHFSQGLGLSGHEGASVSLNAGVGCLVPHTPGRQGCYP
jgi:hypothetical protein